MGTTARRRALVAAGLAFAGAFASVHAEDLSKYTGPDLYRRFCASCHGREGLGDGPVAESLKVMVPDLTRIAKRHGGVFPAEQVRKIVDGLEIHPPHGPRDMPVWGFEFRAADAKNAQAGLRAKELIARLVDYLQSIQVP
jgi:mono/diheme cytochrome c family protein